MVKLRLRRKGRTHYPIYDIVAMDGRSRRDGAFLERLGYYDPHQKPSTIKVDHERAIYWLSVGAQPTDTVRLLLSYDGVLLRRAMGFKGKSAEEIESMVEKHRETVKSRWSRKKVQRADRIVRKLKEAEEAKKAEEAAKIAAKAAEEAAKIAAKEAEEAAKAAEEAAKAAADAAAAEAPAEA